jgi:ABC-type antimicrobial peptide transport system permease subunit
MTLVLAFAATGLALALVGVYGVMAQLARGRRREIGIRVALGAPLPGIRRMVMGRAAALALTGVGIGTAVALAGSQAVKALLFDIEPTDPLTLVSVGLLLTLAAVAASWPPARRAARVEPMESLRVE